MEVKVRSNIITVEKPGVSSKCRKSTAIDYSKPAEAIQTPNSIGPVTAFASLSILPAF